MNKRLLGLIVISATLTGAFLLFVIYFVAPNVVPNGIRAEPTALLFCTFLLSVLMFVRACRVQQLSTFRMAVACFAYGFLSVLIVWSPFLWSERDKARNEQLWILSLGVFLWPTIVGGIVGLLGVCLHWLGRRISYK